MLASNQPFQRVDDGIGAGLISGAVIGAALAGTAHRWGQQGIDAFRNASTVNVSNSQAHMNRMGREFGLDSQQYQAVKNAHAGSVRSHARNMKMAHHAENLYNKGFGGGWKGKALAYGGSILAGSLLGATVDALND